MSSNNINTSSTELNETCENSMLDNRYVLLKRLGSGSFGEVYKVLDTETQEIKAVKLFKIDDNKMSFEKEENMMKKLDKYDILSNIKFYDSGIGLLTKDGLTEKRKYIIMEYGSEENLLKKVKKTPNGFSEDSGKYMLYEIVEAVKSLHKIGITHRDIKPDNMFFVGEGQNMKLKLCDFGLSTVFKDEKYVKIYLNEHVGTPAFVAPEIIKHKSYDGEKIDVFSIGVTIFSLLTKKIPFQACKNNYELTQTLYRYITKRKITKYWYILEHSKEVNLKPLSDDFKELFIKMVESNPKKRITLDEILDSKWMKDIKYASKEYLEMLRNKMISEM